jgi:uncharacterized membrane protein
MTEKQLLAKSEKPKMLKVKKARRPVVSVTEHFSGPLPPPSALQAYEKAHPGAAERILKMAEEQATHRQTLERKVVESNIFNEKAGMVLGFVLLISLMSIGAVLVYSGKKVEGLAALLSSPAIPAIAYFYTKLQDRKNSEEVQSKVDK